MKHLTRILTLCAVLTAFLFVTAVHAQESGESPSVQVTSAPTVNGHAISAADLDGLTEIAVALSVAADSPTQITVFAPFYDENGKFIGAGVASATVDDSTTSVTLPIAADVSGAASVEAVVADAAFRPLTVAAYPIGTDAHYSLRAEAKNLPYGGNGKAYLMADAPTAATVLPDTPVTENVFSAASGNDVIFYVIFAPDKGSELAETPIVKASEFVSWGLEMLPVTLESSPASVAYRVVAKRDLNASDVSLTVTGAFRSVGSGGNETPIL